MTSRPALFIATALLITNTQALQAQRADTTNIKTLFGAGRDMDNGGWGAPSVHYTTIMGKDALLTGLRGGWLIDHRVTLGLAGQGLVTDVPNVSYDEYLLANGHELTKKSQFRMGYGGLLIEPIIAHRSAVHVSLPLIIGAGGCAYQIYEPLPEDFDPLAYSTDAQAFFVVEPGIELEMNVIKLVRFSAGASYRYTTDITLPGTPSDALRGFNAGVTIKVGKF